MAKRQAVRIGNAHFFAKGAKDGPAAGCTAHRSLFIVHSFIVHSFIAHG